jgi:AmiR/NasT family two-component response regulator
VSINIYLREIGLFGDDVVELGREFADYAAVALANANLHAVTAALATQMAEAMASRAVIEQAKGVLIAEQHVDADAAFAILARASRTSNRKLRDFAEALVTKSSAKPT